LNFPDTPPCPGDWNNDGIVSISDMLLVLSEFGCAESCNYDMNGNGSVTTTDILQMLSLFGSTCPE
jgi:Ca2+-binding EF-hand superfamily protein